MSKKIFLSVLIFTRLLTIVISLFSGRFPLTLGEALTVLGYKFGLLDADLPLNNINVIWNIRLPRAILGAIVGGSLAVSGASYQGLFRNPLVSSDILGVSAGAGFGASLAIIFFQNQPLFVYLFAFSFGIAAVVLSYLIGFHYHTTPTIMLVLGGVIVKAIFSSLISLLKYIADPYEHLPSIVFWLMGSLATARYEDLLLAALPMTIGMIGLIALRFLETVAQLVKTAGLTVVMATHFPNHAFYFENNQVRTKIALMNNKKIVAQGFPREVLTEIHMSNTFNITSKVVSYHWEKVHLRYIVPLKTY